MIKTRIAVSVSAAAETTLFARDFDLPFMPSPGATLSVGCGDEMLPLVAEHVFLNLSSGHVFISTFVPDFEGESLNTCTRPMGAPEIVRRLGAAGFVTEA